MATAHASLKNLTRFKALGIDNLRILAGGDGNRTIPSHIEPTLQTAPGEYNEDILKGLDYLIAELERRNMKAVIYLNNAWEWSGGFGTYLEWAGHEEAPSLYATATTNISNMPHALSLTRRQKTCLQIMYAIS